MPVKLTLKVISLAYKINYLRAHSGVQRTMCLP